MSEAALSGAEFKQQLRDGTPKLGLFVNSHSPTVAEQLAHSGYDWLLVDTQHGPMDHEKLSYMLAAIASGGAKSIVRVGGYDDRPGIQQALDLGADGVLIPYINNADEARQAVSCNKYPTTGTRSVYFPQRSMNKAGLLGYAGNANKNLIVALQVETASCIENMAEIAAVPGVDILVPRPERSVHVDGPLRKIRVPSHVHIAGTGSGHAKARRAGPQEQSHSRTLPLRHRPRGRVPGKGIHLHQPRQRSSSRSDPNRRLRERRGKNIHGKRQALEAPSNRAFLVAVRDKAGCPTSRDFETWETA